MGLGHVIVALGLHDRVTGCVSRCAKALGIGSLWRIPNRGSATAPGRVIPFALGRLHRGSRVYSGRGRGRYMSTVSPVGFPSGSYELGSHLRPDPHGWAVN